MGKRLLLFALALALGMCVMSASDGAYAAGVPQRAEPKAYIAIYRGGIGIVGNARSSPAWGRTVYIQGRYYDGSGDAFQDSGPLVLRQGAGASSCVGCVAGAIVDQGYIPAAPNNWQISFSAEQTGLKGAGDDYVDALSGLRFRSHAGDWGEWYTTLQSNSASDWVNSADKSGSAYQLLHDAGWLIGGYESVPPESSQVDRLSPPHVTLTQRLNALPGGAHTGVFLVPLIAAAFALIFTKSPVVMILVIAGTMSVTIWMTGASVWLFMMPGLFAVGGTLLGMQLGFGKGRR